MAGSTPTVLLADDEANIVMLLEMELQAEGFTVLTASDGVTAMKTVRDTPPDLALLDWNMPVMSGMEFLQALSATKMEARPKIIFCTTENGISHIKAAVEAGADEYVMKPFDRETLESKLAIVGVI